MNDAANFGLCLFLFLSHAVCVAFIVSYFQIDLMAVCVLIFISYFHIMGKSRRQQILENRSFKIQAEEGLGSGCVHGCEGGFWLWQT